MSLILQGPRARMAATLFRFDAADCLDELGIFARSYGRRIGGVFSRASAKRARDRAGRMFALPNDAPAVGVLGGESVLFLEPASQNILFDSDAVNLAGWTKVGVTVSANSISGPEVGVSADVLVESTNTEEHYVQRSFASTAATVYAGSAFVRGLSRTRLRLMLFRSSSPFDVIGQAVLDTDTGALTSTIGQEFGVESWGGSWWRLYASGAAITDTTVLRVSALNSSGTASYLGDGSAAFAVASSQVEVGRRPTSPIRTGSSAVTRAADSLYFPFAAAPGPLTIYQRSVNVGLYSADVATRYSVRIGAETPTADPRFALYTSSSGQMGALYDDGVTQVVSTVGSAQAIGTLVEHVGVLAGGWGVQVLRSYDKGPVVAGALSSSAGAAAAWNQARLYLTDNSSLQVAQARTSIVVAFGAQSLETMRELAGVG